MLNKYLTRLILSFLILSCCFSNDAHAADSYDPFARDIKILTHWFEGEFDNSEQLWFERFDAAQVPEDERAERVHTTHIRLDMPEVGDHVFYVEEYIKNNPEKIIRQRFVIFASDADENAIRMKQGFIKEGKRFHGLKNLEDLKFEDVTFLDICDVFWRRRAGQFEGKMKPKICIFGEGDKKRYSVHDLTLSANKYLRTDSTYLVSDDSFYKGTLPGRPSDMRKANRFTCDVTFRPNDRTLSVAEFKAQTQEVKGLSIHSEGGEFQVTRKSDGKIFTYLMREKQYPFYEDRPEFIYFSIKEEGAKRSSVYTVNDLDSRRLGGQFGGIGFHCHRDGYSFQESLEILDDQ